MKIFFITAFIFLITYNGIGQDKLADSLKKNSGGSEFIIQLPFKSIR